MQYCTVTKRQPKDRGMFFTVTGMQGIKHMVYEYGEPFLYRQKWHVVRKTLITSLWKQSSSAILSLLILLFITTRLRMWQLSCRGLSAVDNKACHTYTLTASFWKRKTTKGFSLRNSGSKKCCQTRAQISQWYLTHQCWLIEAKVILFNSVWLLSGDTHTLVTGCNIIRWQGNINNLVTFLL